MSRAEPDHVSPIPVHQHQIGGAKLAVNALRILTWASLVVPPILLSYSAWSNHRDVQQLVGQAIEGTLDVLQEHSLKVFQTTARVLAEAEGVVESARQDEAGEHTAHEALKKVQLAVPEIQSIWAFHRSGRPVVSSTIFPVPKDLDNSDRDYFKAQAEKDAGLYFGENIAAKIGNLTFFVISKRLPSPNGAFDGIVAVTMTPESLTVFYEKLARRGVAPGLFREDGKVLARYPAPPAGFANARTNSTFTNALSQNREAGEYVAISGVDEISRRIAYRRLPNFPLYVTATYQQDDLWSEVFARTARDAAFGLPGAVLLGFISFVALRRTQSLVHEFQRRQLAEASLKQAQRLEAVGHLTGGVAHDFNNLLMVVQGNAQRLKRDPLTPLQLRAIDAIAEAARRGETLTRQLLTFSRRQSVTPEVVDLAERLPELSEMLRASLRGDIILEAQVPPSTWKVDVDISELELALLNLAVNARDSMPDGGVLKMGARNAILNASERQDGLGGAFVGIYVQDTGTGIPPDIVPKIFDPFFTTKGVGRGTGLGLSQVYGFATQAGGTVEVTSELGKGTEVLMYLPCSAREMARVANTATSNRGGPWKILLVEDNDAIGEVTAANLNDLGHFTERAGNAEEALRRLSVSADFDLVISDIVMPGMSGIDLAARIKSNHPDLPVILATGYSAAANQARGLGQVILTKPYTIEALLDTAQEAVSKQ